MKIWLATLFLTIPALAWGEAGVEAVPEEAVEDWEAALPQDPNEPDANWVDSSYTYASEQTQALAEWMDGFFGVPNYDLEQAESLVRLQWTNSWDQDDDYNTNLRLRGKLQLPRISKRLNLVFSGADGDQLDGDNRTGTVADDLDDRVGLVYEVSETQRSRFDLTMGITWNKLRPGVRYRYQNTIGEFSSYRYTQRLQYETGDGFYTTGQLELNRRLSNNKIVRWNNRAIWGEETEDVEWLTRLSLFKRRVRADQKRQVGINYFAAINGATDPSYTKNYRVGILYRRQIYRKFLFMELEPAYNYRKRKPEDDRDFAWSFALRFEIALTRDLQPNRTKRKDQDSAREIQSSTAQ